MFETLGHYKILDRIGGGAIGELYRARDTRSGRTVAVRVVADAIARDADQHARFLRDARASAAISHPYIASLYEIGEEQGRLFLVSEYVPGETLKAKIDGRPLNPRRALDYAIEMADALAEAHAQGVVHGDVRPGSVIVTPKGHPKFLDVGLAAWTAGGTHRAGPYRSPEQQAGEETDARTDVFSLGVVLFEMVTCRPQPTAASRPLPPEINPIVQKMIARNVHGRHASAATVAAELRSAAAALERKIDAGEQPIVPHAAPSRRSRVAWLLAAAILAAIVALVWFASRL